MADARLERRSPALGRETLGRHRDLPPQGLAIYGRVCGWALARAHARSGDRIAIGSYLGNGKTFDKAIAEFSERYADRNELDYGLLADAAKSGRIEVETTVRTHRPAPA